MQDGRIKLRHGVPVISKTPLNPASATCAQTSSAKESLVEELETVIVLMAICVLLFAWASLRSLDPTMLRSKDSDNRV